MRAYDSENTLMHGLLQLSSASLSFGQMVQMQSELLGNPLVVIDAAYRVIAHSNASGITDPIWIKNIQKGSCSMEFIEGVQALPEIRKGKQHQRSYDVLCSISPIPKRVCSVVDDSHHLGDVILIACKREFQELDYYALEQVTRILGYRWKELTEAGCTGENTQQTVLQALLAGEIPSHSEAKRRLEYFNVDLSREIQLFGVDLGKTSLEARKEVMELLGMLFSSQPSVFFRNLLLYFITKPLTQEEKGRLHSGLLSKETHGGLSLSFSNLSQASLAFEEVKQSMDWGVALGKKGGLLEYQKLQLFSLFEQAEPVALERMIPEGLFALEAYDRDNESNLLETLENWIFYGGSIQLTAEQLFVHRNTINYRLGKIQELSHWDLEDFGLRKQLDLALQALRWLGIRSEKQR